MKRVYCLLILWTGGCLLSIEALHALDSAFTIGKRDILEIQVLSGGTYCIYRKGEKQLFDVNSPIFAISIGEDSLLYTSHGYRQPGGFQGDNSYFYKIPQSFTIEDVSAVTTGQSQYITKKFSSTYHGNPFSVTINIRYNLSAPDYIIKEAIIDASQIPAGKEISFAYGWDTYIAGNDQADPLILPDVNKYYNTYHNIGNTTRVAQYVYPSLAEVQSLRFLGAYNGQQKVMMGFFPMGRAFDGIYSGKPQYAYCFNMVYYPPNPRQSLLFSTDKKQLFRYYSDNNSNNNGDNGIGVAYHHIKSGELTTIRTGITFTNDIDGELDYTWNGSKNLEKRLNDDIHLHLHYTSHNYNNMSNVSFRANFPGLLIRGPRTITVDQGAASYSDECIVGSEYYQMKNLEIQALKSIEISIPVKALQAGMWSIDGNSITNMQKTLPLGAPAVLTVKTEANFSSTAQVSLCKDAEHTFTVQYPSGVTATGDADIAILYSDPTLFSNRPDKVTIPAGQNSASFTVRSFVSGPDHAVSNITLSSNAVFVEAGNDKTASVKIDPYRIAGVNLSVSPADTVCEGTEITLTATPTNGGSNPVYVWEVDGKEVSGISGDSYTFTVNWKNRRSKVTCKMTSSDTCVDPLLKTVTTEKKLRVSSCSIPVNPHQRARVFK